MVADPIVSGWKNTTISMRTKFELGTAAIPSSQRTSVRYQTIRVARGGCLGKAAALSGIVAGLGASGVGRAARLGLGHRDPRMGRPGYGCQLHSCAAATLRPHRSE
jgi:hypothetical protein